MPTSAKSLSDPGFADLAATQAGVLSWAQVRAKDIDSHLVARRLATGIWQKVGPRVVVLHGGPLSPEQMRWAAVLHAGAGSALFGLSALEVQGLHGFETPVIHVVSPHGRGRRRIEVDEEHVIRVHESIHLGSDAVHPQRRPAVQRVARAAVDAASTAQSESQCRALLAAVVQQRLATPAQLHEYPVRVPTLRRRVLVLETIGDVAGGAHSLPELQWDSGIRRAGLPRPSRQRTVKHSNGRYYLDSDFDPWMVTAEINGAQHNSLLQREADDERRFLLTTSGGRLVVDISSYLVRHNIERAVLRLARALHYRRWTPEPATAQRLQKMAHQLGEPLWLPDLWPPPRAKSA